MTGSYRNYEILIQGQKSCYNGDEMEANREARPMVNQNLEVLVRKYAAGEMSWHDLRGAGVEDYYDVLAELGRLSLRPPLAPMTGPNVVARRRGIAAIESLLRVRAAHE